jgi:prepilin-type N-terminal cleavage/methylation domain-containing protein
MVEFYSIIDKRHTRTQRSSGFTIVELLIVVIVIGILASITIVSYSGIQSRAREAQMKSNLANVYTQLSVDKIYNGTYPISLAAVDNGKGITAESGASYQYTVNNAASPATFCVTYFKAGIAYFINESGQSASGACSGHSASGVSAPQIAGYYDFSEDDATTGAMTINPGVSIANGSWMVVILSYNADTTPTMPAGWSTLLTRNTIGTLRTSVFAKIKDAGDTFPTQMTVPLGKDSSNGVVFWGTGAAPVSNWVFGGIFGRDGTTTYQYTTVSPALTTASSQNLILAVSTERTTAAETDIVSINGATKWFYIPQIATAKIQTITLGTFTQATAGATPIVTTTYTNPQSNNGQAFQIALPPL